MKRHILVVDDEIGALTLIGIMLERGGFEVLKARDAKTALEVLDGTVPDLIILDVMMPGMNGIDLCQVIRQREATVKNSGADPIGTRRRRKHYSRYRRRRERLSAQADFAS